jgi:negative regulator of flagellin synthesis FlgM
MKIGPIDAKQATLPVVPDRKSNANQPVKAAPGAAVQAPASAGASVGTSASASASAAASTQVALSSAARLPRPGEVDAATFDSAKVDRIAQAIRDGKFVINAEAIADKLILNAEELLGRARSN